ELHPHVRIGELGTVGLFAAGLGKERLQVFGRVERPERVDERLARQRRQCRRIVKSGGPKSDVAIQRRSASYPRSRAWGYVPSMRSSLQWNASSSSARSTAGSPGAPTISA